MVAAVKMQAVPASEPRYKWGSALTRAVRFGDFSQVDAMLADGFDINGATPAGTTLLMAAAAHGQLKLVRRLLDDGASINLQRSDGFNALLFSVFFGHVDVVRELVRRDADLKAESRGGTTAKMWALTRAFLDIEDLLREAETPFVRAKEKTVEPHKLPLPLPEPPPKPIVEPQPSAGRIQVPVRETTPPPARVVNTVPEADYARRESALIESAATPLCVANRESAEAKTFSPISALIERMSLRLKLALVVVVVAMIGFCTLSALTFRNAKTRPLTAPAASTSSLPTVQEEITVPVPQPVVPIVSVETEKPPAAAPVEEAKQAIVSENQPAAEKVAAQHSRALWLAKRNARLARLNRAAQNDQGASEEKTAPAPVTFVTKQPQPRKTAPVEAPTTPAFPIEGTNKKKVIQWP